MPVFPTAFTVMAISPATAARRAGLHVPVTEALKSGYTSLTGVDEAGAGALAGPVVAAAVQLRPAAAKLDLPFLDDSKRLSARRRAEAYEALVKSQVVHCSVHVTPPSVIDDINILNARLRAMTAAVKRLPEKPGLLFVDGDREAPDLDCEQRTVVGGDARISVIAAASIVAKVVRDRIMIEQGRAFPQFSFEKHVGYCTSRHLEELRTNGPCSIHRWSFKPVRLAAERLHCTTNDATSKQ